MPKSRGRRHTQVQTFLADKSSDPNVPSAPADVTAVGTIDPETFEPAFYGDERRYLSTGTRLDLIEPVECPAFQQDWRSQMSNLTVVVSQLCRRSHFKSFVRPDRLRLSGHPVGASILASSRSNTGRHSVKELIVQDALSERELSAEEALQKLPGAVVAATFDIHYRRGTNGVHEFNNCITKLMIVKCAGERGE